MSIRRRLLNIYSIVTHDSSRIQICLDFRRCAYSISSRICLYFGNPVSGSRLSGKHWATKRGCSIFGLWFQARTQFTNCKQSLRIGKVLQSFPRNRFNNFGDPICIDELNGGQIVYLLHDGSLEPRFMNSSLPQLAYSLLAFREAVKATNLAGGKGAYLEGRIPIEVINEFVGKMNDIDPAAVRPDLFWSQSVHL